jgi:hypothetical protein
MLDRITTLASLILASSVIAGDRPAEVEHALSLAGENRAELVRVLDHYEQGDDPQKIEAAYFLIAHMEGHGYAELAYFDADGNEIEFDALEHKNYNKARAAFEDLEKQHGPLQYQKRSFDSDLETITADYLIENIDLAFKAWRTRPWAADISFEVFCEYILPYRGSNEPVEEWRAECIRRFEDITGQLENAESLTEAGRKIQGRSRRWVGFSKLYYLHPTDQGFGEMLESRTGRCEDMSNMMGYACRANAIVAAQDYTPFWANRDNNHAWEVLLDHEGRGRAGLSNKAAKIYRKTYSAQPDALGTIKKEDEKVPRWLARKTYKDVTTDYLETTDATVVTTRPPPEGHRFAYICVFNGGEWRAIHHGFLNGRSVTFTKMGRGIAYLPAYYVDGKLVAAASPFIIDKNGSMLGLGGGSSGPTAVSLKANAGKTWELRVWEDTGWSTLDRREGNETKQLRFEDLASDRLYWLVADGSRRLERIFTIEEGKQRRW